MQMDSTGGSPPEREQSYIVTQPITPASNTNKR